MDYAPDTLRADPCAYCGGAGGHLDHIHPRSRGGSESFNLTATCKRCNSRKRHHALLTFLYTMQYGYMEFQTNARADRIVVALTPEEKRAIEEAASKELLTISDYVRRTLLLKVEAV